MATMKKPAKKMQMGGGTKMMMKKGGSFPDLNKDGKITKKDILIGKGVLPKTAKKGMKVKKAQDGYKTNPYKEAKDAPEVKMTSTKNYDTKITKYPGGGSDTTTTFKPAGGAKFKIPSMKKAKKGTKMTKKCAYGCK
jgi:hypothetical protein